jgi:hypothetical protein
MQNENREFAILTGKFDVICYLINMIDLLYISHIYGLLLNNIAIIKYITSN